jgi:hypothetical protein
VYLQLALHFKSRTRTPALGTLMFCEHTPAGSQPLGKGLLVLCARTTIVVTLDNAGMLQVCTGV